MQLSSRGKGESCFVLAGGPYPTICLARMRPLVGHVHGRLSSCFHCVPLPRWFNTSEQYSVPWVICDRLRVPWYDSRFRGYGQNKIVHLENMNWTGYRFIVHPEAWLIHRRHPHAKAKLQHLKCVALLYAMHLYVPPRFLRSFCYINYIEQASV